MLRILILLTSVLCFTKAAIAEPTASRGGDITVENLLQLEEFWPYQVKLIVPWRPDEGPMLGAPKPGVLVRIEESGLARIDFAAGGVHQVPLENTNVLEQANAIREGAKLKAGANLIVATGPRLIDGSAVAPTIVDLMAINEATSFLCVFADPMAESFSGLAASLRSLEGKHGLRTILFPLGSHVDADVLTVLQQVEWPIAFVMDGFSELYARSLRSSATDPSVIFTSREGRLFFEDQWSGETAKALASVILRRFTAESLTATRPDVAKSASPTSR